MFGTVAELVEALTSLSAANSSDDDGSDDSAMVTEPSLAAGVKTPGEVL